MGQEQETGDHQAYSHPQNSQKEGHLTSFSLSGFRSLRHVPPLALPHLTVMIGSNGAGKSNFIKFFEMLHYMMQGQRLREFVSLNGGADDQLYMGAHDCQQISATLHIDTTAPTSDHAIPPTSFVPSLTATAPLIEYHFTLHYVPNDDGGRFMFQQETLRLLSATDQKIINHVDLGRGHFEAQLVEFAQQSAAPSGQEKTAPLTLLKAAQIIVQLLQKSAIYQFHDTSPHSYLKQAWDETDIAQMRPHGGNLPAILLHFLNTDIRRYKRIRHYIQRVLPIFDDFELIPFRGKVSLRWRHKFGHKTMGAHLTSDGSLRLFCLITLLNLPADMLPQILILDEPELGLHPHAITLISEMIHHISQQKQVIIATQSPYLVDCFDLENIIVAQLQNGATSLSLLDPDKYQHWLKDTYQVSDLWLKNVIGQDMTGPNSGSNL